MKSTSIPASQDAQQASPPVAAELKQPTTSSVPEEPKKTLPESKTIDPDTAPTRAAIRPEVRPHAFVIMPFGKKKSGDGSLLYDFNAIYSQIIKPALEMAGFEAFRADEETASGDILTDMFQELLLADLCIADMSIDNANVFYELGIRHAFRKRGIVHIQAGRSYMPFDVFNVRTIPYHITPEGVPDPEFLEKDKAMISRVARDTWASDIDAVQSPIFNLLDGLVEPDRTTLRTPLATGFWREYNEWKDRLAVAQRQKRIGDIVLLTEEISNPFIKEEAVREAGMALRSMGRYELALTQYRKGLEINPRNLTFRREEAFSLNRLGKVDEAIVKIENLLAEFPRDTEAVALLGRIYKEMWVESWKWVEDKELRFKTAFESYHWLLKSFQTYLKGYRIDMNECYPGVNALTLGTVLAYLADKFDSTVQPDPDIQAVRDLLSELRGSLIFALETKVQDEMADYWTLVSLGELYVLTAEVPQQVTRAYRKALTASRRNQFSLQSSLGQLEMLQAIDMRTEFVEAGIHVVKEELWRIRKELQEEEADRGKSAPLMGTKPPEQSGLVLLFTGYMINNHHKKDSHFPRDKEDEVKEAINTILDKLNAGPDDLAVTAGMDAGSEILFVESCVERGVPVQAYFPVSEAAYVRDFVSPGEDQWPERFYKMRNHPLVDEFYQPDCVGLPRESDNVYERNNRWALYSALARGIDKVRLIAFWDGKSEGWKDLDARMVKHMVDLMRDMGGMVEQINPTKLARTIRQRPARPAVDVKPVPVEPIEPIQEEPSSNGNSLKKPGTQKKK